MSNNKSINAEQAVKALRHISWCIVGGYGIALCYRVGIFRKLLPKKTNEIIENTIEKIKARTEPVGNINRYNAARRHLINVYAFSSLGILTAAMGGATFFIFPKIPIIVPMTLTLIPCSLLLILPKDMMLYVGRVSSLFISCFAFGYSFGPIGWIAWDSLAIFITLLGSTMAGLCIPLFLTRGMISYVLSSQLLSCTLSLAAVTTAPLVMRNMSNNSSSIDILQRADINVFLTLQLLSNWGINLLHTLPMIIHFVRWKGNEEELLQSVDPLKESMCICAGAAYVLWRSSRWACRRLIQYVAKVEDVKIKTKDSKELYEEWSHFSGFSFRTKRVSGVGASVLLILWYIRAVSALQRGETVILLENLRRLCARVSPVSLLVRGQL